MSGSQEKMEGEESDGGPFLSEDVYDMLREDSLVRNMASYNFAQLVESPSSQEQLQVQRPLQYNQFAYAPPVAVMSQPLQQQQHVQQSHLHNQQEINLQQQLQQSQQYSQQQEQHSQHRLQEEIWDSVDLPTPVQNPDTNGIIAVDNLPAPDPVSIPVTVPSLQPWSGRYNFTASVMVDNTNRKWCYSPVVNKLFLGPNIAVPVDIVMHPWVNAKLRITPIFKRSQHLMVPVIRCYNCKKVRVCDAKIDDHVVQVEGDHCYYEVLPDNRPAVTVPLSPPAPGERHSTILVKLMCLTSCVGGPNRRPFCLVLTLHCNSTGREIGRQIIEVKCSKCPNRDRLAEEGQASSQNENNSTISNVAPTLDEEKSRKVRKLASQIKVGQKRKRSNNIEIVAKVEPGTQPGFVNIAVPVEFENDVKKYINGLTAAKLLRRNQSDLLLYPEVESGDTDHDGNGDYSSQ